MTIVVHIAAWILIVSGCVWFVAKISAARSRVGDGLPLLDRFIYPALAIGMGVGLLTDTFYGPVLVLPLALLTALIYWIAWQYPRRKK
jgi:hypothetical protein